jgi:hypothetical protein
MNLSVSSVLRSTVLTCATLAPLATAQTVHYDSSFEAPSYQLGPLAGTTFLNGQDGWLATGDSSTDPLLNQIVVQSALSMSGANAVSIDATGQPTPFAHIRRHTFVNVSPSEPILDIAFDLRLAPEVSARSEWGIQAQAGPGPGSGILEWWIDVAGELHVTGANGFVATGVLVPRDVWRRVVTRIDYVAQTCSVSIDGQTAATVPALAGAAHWAHAFTSLMFIQPGDDRMFVDNFSIVTHDGQPIASYCTAGVSTHGCSATLSATGSPSASAASGFQVHATNVEGAVSATFFYGVQGRVALPWASTSTSFMCVKSPIQRVGALNSGAASGGCGGALSFDFLAYMAGHPTALGQPLQAGQRFNLQAWYRDPAATKATNLSDALEFNLAP